MMGTRSVRVVFLVAATLSAAAVAAFSPTALAAQPSTPRTSNAPPPVAAAARLQGSISVDGRLDEAAWRRAMPVTDFRQYQPAEGEPASLPMDVRILFDDGALYIGARMSQPGGVVAPLARRDQLLDASGDNGSFNSLTTDKLVISLDPYHNRIDNAWFEVNPAGVKGDQFNGDPSWDPIWDAAARADEEGWIAEMRIPYSQLRFSTDRGQVWGMQIWRYIDARNEQNMWSFWRRNASGGPAFYGEITGLEIGHRPRQLELLPYAVAGGTFEDAVAGDPYRDGRESNFGVGADIKYLLTSNLTLDATLNPDFGQVEVDPASLNLSAYETYYDEKRPFFIAGSSAFSFGGMRCMFCSNSSGLSAFYSRRIGRPPQLDGVVQGGSEYADAPENTTILGAAKITGRTQGGYTVGVLNAVTSEETARFLRGSGAPEASQVVEPLSNYFVGRVKKDFNRGNTQVGTIFTSAARSAGDSLVGHRLHSHAEAVGLDWRHHWSNRDYSWMGSMMVSSVAGSAEAIARTQRSSAHYFQRPDRSTTGDGLFSARLDPAATALRGYGLFTRVGKDGGTLVWEAMGNVRSPGFEVNDLSFLSRTDFVWFNGNAGANFTTPTSWYRSIGFTLGGATQYNYDGDRTYSQLQAFYGMELPNYWNVRTFGIRSLPSQDDRLTRGGPVVKRDGFDLAFFGVSTDARRAAVFDVGVNLRRGIESPTSSFGVTPGIALKPAANVFIQLSPSYSQDESDAQYLTAVADPMATSFQGTRYVFGFVKTKTVSLDTRINWTFTPNLTLQLYAQPFIASGDYTSFREFARPRGIDKVEYGTSAGTVAYDAAANTYRIDPDGAGAAAPFTLDNPDFTTSSLRGTAVLRWEYRPGSTLYFVWTQQRSGYDPTGSFDVGRARSMILDGKATNVFQVKATYWLGR
ncbi:MAG: DUF5916 domain-containing protein [Longimicrobiales bacterium]